MAQQTRRCVRITSRDEGKRKCIKDRRISGGVAGRGDPVFRCASKPVVGHHRMGQDPLSILWIPIMPGGDGCNLQRFRYDEVLRRTG